MSTTVAIRYIDAFYINDKKLKDVKLPTYVAVGNLTVFDEYILISFANLEKDDTSLKGLLVPKTALIFEDRPKYKSADIFDSLIDKDGFDIGIFWKDVVYFENGNMPKKLTKVYTEGKFLLQTSDAIVIDNPETIATRNKGSSFNHPVIKPTFFVIPKCFIVGIETYE